MLETFHGLVRETGSKELGFPAAEGDGNDETV